MGSSNVDTSTLGIRFADGTYQTTAASVPNIQYGVAVCTGSGPTVNFSTSYTGSNAPIVVVTGLDGVDTHSLFYSVAIVGSSGAWTGFTLNLSGTLYGAFGWIAIG